MRDVCHPGCLPSARCGPCKMLEPTLEKLAEQLSAFEEEGLQVPQVLRMDSDQHSAKAQPKRITCEARHKRDPDLWFQFLRTCFLRTPVRAASFGVAFFLTRPPL